MLKRIINYVDDGKDFNDFKLTLLDAVIILKQAWEKVEPATIRNCFKKANFQVLESEAGITETETETEYSEPDVEPFLSLLLVEYGIPDTLHDMENLDSDAPEELYPSAELQREDNETPDDEDDQGEEIPMVSEESVAVAMETLSQYFMQKGLTDELLSKVQKTIDCQKVQSKKQTSLTSFFKPAPKSKRK